ncbi:MAG: hypothetical protein J4F50_08640 [Acidimicrobiia bacterium]|nr:hypothetical protein [Acidimicrobiia bacterium]
MDQTQQKESRETSDAPRDALDQLIAQQPERHPLVFGFVGAIGTPWERILRDFTESLRRFDYSASTVHLSRLVDNLDYRPWGELPERGSTEYYERRMNAGDLLRAKTRNGSAMAALAVREVAAQRNSSENESSIVFLLRSLKHPDEVTLLRHVYGRAFFLIGVACSIAERRHVLSESLSHFGESRAGAERLISRDESDPNNRDYGQNVRDTYSMADVFVPGATGIDVRSDIDRFIDSVFGTPFLTPTPHEEGMRFAQVAALRSAAASRQVGAALIPVNETPFVAGTNEVPKPGGGQYWTSDSPDFRDFKTGRDPNKVYIKWVVQDLLERLRDHNWLSESLGNQSGPELVEQAFTVDESGLSVLGDARVAALIEFTRCLHAEQATIINAARSGVVTQGAVLYSTTFPCHECAKMIIGAGIAEVHYIEPYPKNLVNELFRDMIDVSPAVGSPGVLVAGKFPFHQFLGIAPRWYAEAFTAGRRRIGDQLVDFDPRTANPITSGWCERGDQEREVSTDTAISRMIEQLAAEDAEGEKISGKQSQIDKAQEEIAEVS